MTDRLKLAVCFLIAALLIVGSIFLDLQSGPANSKPAPHAARIALVHALTNPTLKPATGTSAFNWGGYADVSGDLEFQSPTYFTYVVGTWRVPRVICPSRFTKGVGAEDTIVADWVGIDGVNDQTVEQTGTSSQCFNGSAFYYVWYELYPQNSVTVVPIEAGDLVTGSVKAGRFGYQFAIVNHTDPAAGFKRFVRSTTISDDASVEWVIERPAFQIGIVPLADYGKTTFTNLQEKSDGPFTQYDIATIDATDGYFLQTESPIVHDSFTSTWRNSY